MLWKASEAVPEGNDPVPQKEEPGSDQPTLADIYRLCVERFDRMDSYSDRWNEKLGEISDEMKKMDNNITRLEHGARQPRLAMEADRQTLRLASAQRAPQQQYKQYVGIAFLHAGLNPAQPPTRPVSA